MYVLGLNAFHGDSSACLLRDGEIVAAAEEERFRRIKHWAGFPSQAVAWCLSEAGIGLSDVGHVALNQDSGANLDRKIGFALRSRPDLGLIFNRFRNKRKRLGADQHLEAAFPGSSFRGEVHAVEHHLAHLASAYYGSRFERAVVLSVDGFGDFASGAWGLGEGARLELESEVYFPHSLGMFYQAMTQFIGFPHYGDEYKVMGLAPYGRPAFIEKMREIVKLQDDGSYRLDLKYFRHHREQVPYTWEGGAPTVGTIWADALTDLLGPARRPDEPLTDRHRDIAHSVQAMYEEAFFHLLAALARRHDCDALALAGGCGMNSVANGKYRRRSPFRRLYVQSAAGDAGGALGAAQVVWARLSGGRPAPMDHAYLGPAYGAAEIDVLLDSLAPRLREAGCAVIRHADEDALCRETAAAVADGQVVGWFQGRMEWGPRALGNRSILGDPRRADMKDILNLKIKRRESFRPFAPSVLRERVPDWFEEDDEVPFMMKVFQVREERRSAIPAVTHVDGSARLQTVSRLTNARYHRLIGAFEDLTGVPMVLNTSFNENEPVVCRPEEAVECFLRTKMDILVLGDTVIRRVDN